jgi:hypothetical protein
MTRWTFEIQWPLPFDQTWKRSSQRFHRSEQAGTALGEYLAISADNGTILLGRLVSVKGDE